MTDETLAPHARWRLEQLLLTLDTARNHANDLARLIEQQSDLLAEVLDAADAVWARQDVGPRDEDWQRLRGAIDGARP